MNSPPPSQTNVLKMFLVLFFLHTTASLTLSDCSFNADKWVCTIPLGQTSLFDFPVLGPVNITAVPSPLSVTTTSLSRCLVSNCATFNYKCTCSSSIGNNQCSLGQFYTLRNGPMFITTGILPCNSNQVKTWCTDTNWQPTSPFTCLDFAISTSVNFTTSPISSSGIMLYPFSPSVLNLTLSNPLNQTLVNSAGTLRSVIGNFNLFSASFQLASPNLLSQAPVNTTCNGTTPLSYTTSGSSTICPNFTLAIPNVSISATVNFQLFPTNIWSYQLFTIGSLQVPLAICRTLCYFPVGGEYTLVSNQFSAYGVYPPLGTPYECSTDKCITKDCCFNPPLLANPCSLSLGSVVCVDDIVTFNSTNSSFVPVDPLVNHYCSLSTGQCFKPLDNSYSWNVLSIILAIIGSLLLVILMIMLALRALSMRLNTMLL